MTHNRTMWNIKELYEVPSVYPTDLFHIDGMASFFYEGVQYHDGPTKVYAYYKAPKGLPPQGGWPAVVLVHGGGGTAFPWMIERWNEQGFAAIAMDLEGHLPDLKLSHEDRPSHAGSGPCRKEIFEDYELPLSEQWIYHAIANVVRANTLIRSFDAVNSEQVGIFGVSWGGIITTMMVGIDDRYSFAIPVYGCGYLGESDGVLKPTKEQSALWEPMHFITRAPIKTPMLFINGTNDRHFPLDTWGRTTNDMKTQVWRCILVNFDHGHKPVFDICEHFEFAKAIIKERRPSIVLGQPRVEEGQLIMSISGHQNSSKMVLCYTKDLGLHVNRVWHENELKLSGQGLVHVAIPKKATAMFINVIDRTGISFSSAYIEL